MRRLKLLLLAALALSFVAGLGTGAWIGTLAAATHAPPTLDRRVDDFTKALGLDASQARRLREVLLSHDRHKEEILERTPEQFQRIRALEAQSRERIREMLTEAQRSEYDRLTARR